MREGLRRDAIVVGGGPIGTCTALQLVRRGWKTALIERSLPGGGCSSGSAGMIANEVASLISSPNAVKNIPGYIFNRNAPVSIRWSYAPRLLPWLARFVVSATNARYQQGTKALSSLTLHAMEAYEELLPRSVLDEFTRYSGALQICQTSSTFANVRADVSFKRRLGSGAELLGPNDIRALVPELASIYVGGVYRRSMSYIIDPLRFVRAIHGRFEELGGRTVKLNVSRIEAQRGKWRAVGSSPEVSAGEVSVSGDVLVIACGAWSAELLRTINLPVRLDTERGYHVALPQTPTRPRMPVLVTEGGFYMTPMRDGLRLAGRVEFAGVRSRPDYRHCSRMLIQAKRILPDLDDAGRRYWMGHRPSMPDSLPVIGEVPNHPGLLMAFGHGHLGLTLGAITGKLVRQLASGDATTVDLHPFRANRF